MSYYKKSSKPVVIHDQVHYHHSDPYRSTSSSGSKAKSAARPYYAESSSSAYHTSSRTLSSAPKAHSSYYTTMNTDSDSSRGSSPYGYEKTYRDPQAAGYTREVTYRKDTVVHNHHKSRYDKDAPRSSEAYYEKKRSSKRHQ